MNDVTCVWQIPALLGEGPLWVADENALYWVDVLQRQVHRLEPASGQKQSWTFAEPITSLALRQSGGFVGTTPDGFAVVNFETQTVEPIVLPEAHLPNNRFNDGKVDGNGRFWAGSLHRGETDPSGTLYRLDPDLTLHTMDTGYI
ncbi:MAG: SMP-30/gluconolactonase/LRE family protein, partial [Candidatus Promineifilaceae bacterium]